MSDEEQVIDCSSARSRTVPPAAAAAPHAASAAGSAAAARRLGAGDARRPAGRRRVRRRAAGAGGRAPGAGRVRGRVGARRACRGRPRGSTGPAPGSPCTRRRCSASASSGTPPATNWSSPTTGSRSSSTARTPVAPTTHRWPRGRSRCPRRSARRFLRDARSPAGRPLVFSDTDLPDLAAGGWSEVRSVGFVPAPPFELGFVRAGGPDLRVLPVRWSRSPTAG